jgi:hypothetical protein
MSTPFLSVVLQRHGMDCGVACLAMLLNVSYESALLAMGRFNGACIREIKAAAVRLGTPLRLTRKFDLEHDTGILAVRSPKWGSDHVVILKDGLIVDTDGSIWDQDVYVGVYKITALSLLVREDECSR